MNRYVAESHDLAEIRNSGRKRRIEAIESIERLAENLELALDRGAQDKIAVEICETFCAPSYLR